MQGWEEAGSSVCRMPRTAICDCRRRLLWFAISHCVVARLLLNSTGACVTGEYLGAEDGTALAEAFMSCPELRHVDLRSESHGVP